MSKNEPTFRERALFLFNPKKGSEAYRERVKREREQEKTGEAAAPRMSYGSHGASQTLNSMVGWIIDAGNAEDNIDL